MSCLLTNAANEIKELTGFTQNQDKLWFAKPNKNRN